MSEEWQDPFGSWSDLPDTILDDLDQIRRASQPTPPITLDELNDTIEVEDDATRH